MKPIKLTPAVRDLANGTDAGKDASPILTGVFVNDREAVATNHFILVIKTLQTPQEMDLDGPKIDDGIRQVIIPADALKACKGDYVELKTIETMVKPPVGQLGNPEPRMKTIVRLDGKDFSVEADSIEGDFPQYENLFMMSPLIAQIAFSPAVIKSLLKTLPDEGVLSLRISSVDKPVEFQCSDPDGDIPIRGLINPMDISWIHTKWLTLDGRVTVDIKAESEYGQINDLSIKKTEEIRNQGAAPVETVTVEKRGRKKKE